MNILLVQPRWGDVYGHYRNVAKLSVMYPPLGLCYLASVAKEEGHKVKIVDADPDDLSLEGLLEETKGFDTNVLGLTCTTPIYYNAVKVAEFIKTHTNNVKIVVGGAHVTVEREKILAECGSFDHAICGEGELTFLNYLKCLSGKIDIKDVKGLVHREGGNIKANPPQDLIKDLDGIKYPDRSLLNLDNYKWSVPGKGIVRVTSITTTRGCPFKCIFCSQRNVFGEVVRERSEENILDEIKFIKDKYNIHHLFFTDDTFTLNRKRLSVLANRLIDERINITFEASTRVNCVDYETLKLLKKAGMVRVSFGIETGDPEIMKRIKKGITLSEVKDAFCNAKKAGLETKGSVMLGHPGETRESIEKTLAFIKGLKDCDQIHLSVSTPYPGTELYEMVKQNKYGMSFLHNDFSKYKRYGGDPVIKHPNITGEDLKGYQQRGLLEFYLTPKRIYYNLLRAGILVGIKNSLVFFKSVILKK